MCALTIFLLLDYRALIGIPIAGAMIIYLGRSRINFGR